MTAHQLTYAQRQLLRAARDHGNPWKIGGTMQAWRAGRQAAIDKLVGLGLLGYPAGKSYGAPAITKDGLAALHTRSVAMHPAYDQPRSLAYINKVIQRHHGFWHLTLTRDEGYHTLTYDDGVVHEERTVMLPYTNDQTLGAWVNDALAFNDYVKGMYS